MDITRLSEHEIQEFIDQCPPSFESFGKKHSLQEIVNIVVTAVYPYASAAADLYLATLYEEGGNDRDVSYTEDEILNLTKRRSMLSIAFFTLPLNYIIWRLTGDESFIF